MADESKVKSLEINKDEMIIVTHKGSAWKFYITVDDQDDLQYTKEKAIINRGEKVTK